MSRPRYTQLLVDLGFTGLEAEVYVFLLRESPVTGYRVAQAIGKPAANTYKAIESLERKGAILVEEGESRLCRAVEPQELLGRLRREFDASCRAASEVLSRVQPSSQDDRLYQLRTRGQVVERARGMLGECQYVALCDAAPAVLRELEADFEAAWGRGVEVVLKTYAPIEVRGARVIVRPRGHEITEALPGDTISLNTDGMQHLLGLMGSGGEEVFQAIWTRSVIFSYLLYNGLINECSQAAAMAELEGPTTVEALRSVFLSLRHLHPVSSRGPAYQNLMRQLGVRGRGGGPRRSSRYMTVRSSGTNSTPHDRAG